MTAAHPSSAARQVAPDQLRPLEKFLSLVGPRGLAGIADLGERRARYEEIMSLAASRAPDETRVSRHDETLRVFDGREIPLRLYRPAGIAAPAPALVYVHGGGGIMGSIAAEDGFAAELAEMAGAVVLSVGYALSPEHPGSDAIEDCCSAVGWLAETAGPLGVDPQRLGLYGVSAGGGLAAGAALTLRERGGPPLRILAMLYPMLDEANRTGSSRRIRDLGVWDRDANLEAWRLRCGDRPLPSGPHLSPAHAADLSGLPPVYMDVGDLDLFLDECLVFASRLAGAGVPIELHVHPGSYHGFDQLAPRAAATRAAHRSRQAALAAALAPCSIPEGSSA